MWSFQNKIKIIGIKRKYKKVIQKIKVCQVSTDISNHNNHTNKNQVKTK